ncbi:cytochrome C biogenesis protein CcdA [Rhodobacterales bacterium 52_120_T64]|nr:cytochrome C biogenesis protein CcdA [Rhodobacterales bacterium 52_120_T64]
MEFLLGYGAGLLTLINPCVLPVLPIVLASALQNHKHGPLALAAGMSLTFVILGVGVATLGASIGLDADRVSQIGAVMMLGFGAILLIPQLNSKFALATAGVASDADTRVAHLDQTRLVGQFVGGALLGAVWSPCVGPTLGGAISLAYGGESLVLATGIMISFAMGISTIIIALGYGAREAIKSRQAAMRVLAEKSKPLMGIIFVTVGLMILTRFNQVIEVWLLDLMPDWLLFFSVSI